jgi:NAD(P)H-hydrate epimerase
MKLLSAQQIQQWDAFTIREEPVTSIDLMERAAQQCADWIIHQEYTGRSIKIFCGKGNNGGDGLAIARLLIEKGYQPVIYILEFGAKGTDDFQLNLYRLHQQTTEIHFIQSTDFIPVINKQDIVVDALYGSGLNRPLQLLSADVVRHINSSGAVVLSIDVPSGMSIDKSSLGHVIIQAGYTLTFQSFKLCFLVAENAAWFGKVEVLDIGLQPQYEAGIDTVFEVVSKKQILSGLKRRDDFSHKGNYGHALLIAGNTGKMGAALLASKACLRTGAGLVTLNITKEYLPVLHVAIPEVMAVIREEEISLNGYTAVGIGPGLGTGEEARNLLSVVLQQFPNPMVIDADALNIISQHKELLEQIPAASVLTPHPKEFERLVGVCANDFERLDKAIEWSARYPFIIVLKGHYTLIACGGKGWLNTTGNAGLAKGGSGDTLTGIITSLLAQKYTPLQAALTGVYLHGLAADLALENQSTESLTASDVIDTIGRAYNYLKD